MTLPGLRENKMDGKIIIVDLLNKRFVQCETEDDCIMLTKEVSKAETYNADRAEELAAYYTREHRYDFF